MKGDGDGVVIGFALRGGVVLRGEGEIGIGVEDVDRDGLLPEGGADEDVIEDLGLAEIDVGVTLLGGEILHDVDEAGFAEGVDGFGIVVGVEITHDEELLGGVLVGELLDDADVPRGLSVSAGFGGFFTTAHGEEVIVEQGEALAIGFDGEGEGGAAHEAVGGRVLDEIEDGELVFADEIADVDETAVKPFEEQGLIVCVCEGGGLSDIFEDGDVFNFLDGDDIGQAGGEDGVGDFFDGGFVFAEGGSGRAADGGFGEIEEIFDVPGHDA